MERPSYNVNYLYTYSRQVSTAPADHGKKPKKKEVKKSAKYCTNPARLVSFVDVLVGDAIL